MQVPQEVETTGYHGNRYRYCDSVQEEPSHRAVTRGHGQRWGQERQTENM